MQDKKQHSVKVPRLYKVAAGVLVDHLNGQGSVKNLVHSEKVQKKHPNFKAIYALVSSCVNRLSELRAAFTQLDLLNKEKPLQESLALVLATELLWGKQELPGNSKPIQTVRQYGDQLRAHLLDVGSSLTKNCETIQRRPRFVRVNTLLADAWEVTQHFRREGYEQLTFPDDCSYENFVSKIKSLQEHQFIKDFHVPNLFVFNEKVEFHQHPLHIEGKIILQDKASCLPVLALNPPQGATVLDACAAPGMKTSQLVAQVAAGFGKPGHVIAIERNENRCNTLKSLLNKYGADAHVEVHHQDFLTLDPKNYDHVNFVLLDPTCSGSGMKDRSQGTTDLSETRLQKLSGLQCKMLRHALSFPNVQRVSYSTCSLEKKENEEVINDVLNSDYVRSNFDVVDGLAKWERRGKSRKKFSFASKVIRSDPDEDLCNGFFVAIFERKVSK